MPPPPSVLAATATAAELLATAAVVHQLVRHPMRQRGLPRWTIGDTLLTSPLFFAAAALFLLGLNGAVVALASASGGVGRWLGAAVVGAAMAVFGVRAFGKLH